MNESKPFITEDFLLQTPAAQRLYHEYAENQPIIDYHCHLVPAEAANNIQYRNMTHIWLAGDHYKWRAMRTAGVAERYITGKGPDGNASDWEKFEKWAETYVKCLRNPLYHWTALELNNPFGIKTLLSPQTAPEIWEKCNAMLTQPEFFAQGIMRRMNVETVCTTDDPVDSLEYHIKAKNDPTFPAKMLPTMRPDKAMAIDKPNVFLPWLEKLESVTGAPIATFDALFSALEQRYEFFASVGCKLSDHGLGMFPKTKITAAQADAILKKAIARQPITPEEADGFARLVLIECCKLNHKFGWTQQFHFGAMRNNSSRIYKICGPDAGCDSIADGETGLAMSSVLDELDSTDQLARSILYNLNPACNAMVATMIGNFQDGSYPGKIQYGSGWWFLDQKQGMEDQINILSAEGLLSLFVGMLTDSRSFLSYTRHEYFRRILCNMLGNDMTNGLIPYDFDLVGELVENVSYKNAKNYFNF
jgi:glucuronate isomerase